jgi:tetratricopeptide (TPR) repeat protein
MKWRGPLTITLLLVFGIFGVLEWAFRDSPGGAPSGLQPDLSFPPPVFARSRDRYELEFRKRVEDAFAYLHRQKWDAAIKSFSRAIEINHQASYPYYGRGYALLMKNRFDDAINDFTSAVQLGADPRLFYNRGLAYSKKGDPESATADFTKCIGLTPDDDRAYWAYYSRGIARNRTGDTSGAILDETKAISLVPTNSAAYNGRAWIYYLSGSLTDALTDANHAIELNQKDPNALGTRGWIEFGLSNTNQALIDLATAVSLGKNTITPDYDGGLICYLRQEYAQAILHWNKAIEMEPSCKHELEPWIAKAEANERQQ